MAATDDVTLERQTSKDTDTGVRGRPGGPGLTLPDRNSSPQRPGGPSPERLLGEDEVPRRRARLNSEHSGDASGRRHSEPKTPIVNDKELSFMNRRVRSMSPALRGFKPRRQAREFTQRLVKEALQTPLVHYPEGKLAPPPDLGKDDARDNHDLGNLLTLPILIIVDVYYLLTDTNMAYWIFFGVVLFYFASDLIWVITVPKCVKSVLTIKIHHTVSMLYLILPFSYPEYGRFLGYVMLVELNTWFLIARRYWRRSSKIFSIGFYITWVTVRVGLFTYLMISSFESYLEKVFLQLDVDESGTLTRKEIMRLRNWVHLMMLAPMFQTVFCALNWKWTYDLILQKMKGAGPSKGL